MKSDVMIVFSAINALEAAVIIIGNTITTFVFWAQRSHMKRTCFLLINLAVADLLVGISEPVVLATKKIPRIKGGPKEAQSIQSPANTVHIFASNASIFFLALISLERAFAVLWPFRHRVMSTKMHVYSCVFTWAVDLCLLLLRVVPLPVKKRFVNNIKVSCRGISLLIICASYAMIRRRLRTNATEFELHNRRVTERNLKLCRTFFIVVALSLVFWLPAFVAYTVVHNFCVGCLPTYSVPIVNILHLANSMVNPFVYAFRMPIFKVALRKFWRKRKSQAYFNQQTGLGKRRSQFTIAQIAITSSAADIVLGNIYYSRTDDSRREFTEGSIGK